MKAIATASGGIRLVPENGAEKYLLSQLLTGNIQVTHKNIVDGWFAGEWLQDLQWIEIGKKAQVKA